MDSGTTHHATPDLNNLGIHSEYQGPEEVTIGHFLIKDLVTRDIVQHTGLSNNGLYSLSTLKSSTLASYAASLGVWQARLAHTSFSTVPQALSSSVIIPSFKSSSLCSTCAVSKSHKVPFHESSFQAFGSLDLVCLDV